MEKPKEFEKDETCNFKYEYRSDIADTIKNMTDEEINEFMDTLSDAVCEVICGYIPVDEGFYATGWYEIK